MAEIGLFHFHQNWLEYLPLCLENLKLEIDEQFNKRIQVFLKPHRILKK